ncbi:hypothetical protein KHQ88_00760 [Mycoplasmatota bacterium]|nr:hypothetical protein KHQ88_00760 [Mycoplasmatota bacterium]
MQLNKIIDEKVRKLLDYSKSMNISAQDLKRVDVLSLANQPIKSLADISNMTNLKKVEISGTKIKDINYLQYTPNLEVFAAYDNEITDFSVLSQLTNLKELYINNDISDKVKAIIGLIGRLEILSLGVSHGNLVFLKNLHSLKILHIKGKSIDLEGVEHLSSLERLIIDSEKVENLERLKNLPNFKQVSYSNMTQNQKEELETYGIKVDQAEEDIYPLFISEIGNFKLSSGLKNDAKDTFIAFNIIWAVVLVILILVFIFNSNALRPIWETITVVIGVYLFIPVSLSLWLYLMDFELEMTNDVIIIQRVWGYQRINIIDIEEARFKEQNMKQSIIKLRAKNRKYRLVCSVFTSHKLIDVFKKSLKENGIKILSKD